MNAHLREAAVRFFSGLRVLDMLRKPRDWRYPFTRFGAPTLKVDTEVRIAERNRDRKLRRAAKRAAKARRNAAA